MSASSFHFGFTGDDIAGTDEICSEGRPHELQTEKVADGAHRQQATPVAAQHVGGSRISPQRHSLEELLSHLPSQVSYSTLHIPIVPSERATDRRDDGPIRIPRREVFDIRMQLMASDEAVEEDDVAAGDATSRAAERLAAQTSLLLLGEDDIKTSVYEGGLKSWECSIDLIKVLARERMRFVQGQGTGDHAHVLELGCGTALPSLYLFQRVLEEGYRNVHFTLADYNIDVLRLVTIPNLLLSWVMFQQCHSSPESAAASPAAAAAAPSPPPMNSPEELSSSALWQAESDVEITAGLLERFTADLEERGFTIDAVSGPWGEEFTSLLPAVPER
ncbi:MAG: hypothetical protein M1815_001630 [Lichina confinis]|nr:MAG: hypothetical protein M1815_001630 [Lichina confinis]